MSATVTLSPRGRRLEELFSRALELAGAERQAFLAAACGADDELRRELSGLLCAHDQAGAFLDAPAIAGHPAGEPAAEGSVGPYRLRCEIGRGGMSTVWLAERADREFDRQVAIKFILGDMISAEVKRRFQAERQILAGLEHPNIARLYDGGTTPAGRPYFVLEYVEGLAIDADCARRGLGLGERLALFRTVCTAVDYAHRKLVIHRDLKPGNILVTADGIPKLLDFGIAKLLSPTAFDDPNETATVARRLTPQYASPEQFRGEPLSTAADIYSLGVLLYKLVTDSVPYRLSQATAEEVERCHAAGIPRPSTVAGGPFGRQLAGDLDNIVAKALHPEPERRYSSAMQLAEDVKRHQDGLPVLAREDTLGYRLGKFLRRHRGSVAATALAVALTAGFAVLAAVQSVRAGRERDQARQVAKVLTDLFTAADPYAAGPQLTLRTLLDQESERALHELAGQPRVQAQLLDVIGTAYQNLSLFDRARPLLERALEIRRHENGSRSLEVAESLDHLGSLRRARFDLRGAEALFLQALAIRRAHGDEDDPRVLETRDHLAELGFYRGDLGGAEAIQRDVLARRRRVLPPLHLDLAGSLNDLAETRLARGDLREAEDLARQALAQRRQLLGADHPLSVDSLDLESALLLDRGDFAAAVPLLEEVLVRRRRRLGGDHPRVATSLANLGAALQQTGKDAAAEPLLREALAIRRKVFGNDNPIVANSLYGLAYLLGSRGDLAAAEGLFAEALAVRRGKLAPGAWETGATLTALGDVVCRRGDIRRAEPLLREGLAVQRRALTAASPRLFAPVRGLGSCLALAHRYSEAEPLLLERYRLLATGDGGTVRRRRQALADLVQLYRDWGRPQAAEPFAKLLTALPNS